MKKILKTLCALSIVVVLAACNEEAGSGAPAPAAKTNFAVSLPGVPETYGVEDPPGRRSDRTLLQRRDGLPGGCRRQYGGACLERRRDQFETETVRTDCRTFEGARIREHGQCFAADRRRFVHDAPDRISFGCNLRAEPGRQDPCGRGCERQCPPGITSRCSR